MGLIEDKLRRDLALRGMRPATIATYVRCCRRFVTHFGHSPVYLSASDARLYLEHFDTGWNQCATPRAQVLSG